MEALFSCSMLFANPGAFDLPSTNRSFLQRHRRARSAPVQGDERVAPERTSDRLIAQTPEKYPIKRAKTSLSVIDLSSFQNGQETRHQENSRQQPLPRSRRAGRRGRCESLILCLAEPGLGCLIIKITEGLPCARMLALRVS